MWLEFDRHRHYTTGKHITKLLVHLDNNPVMNRVNCSNISSHNSAQSSDIDLILWCLVMN